MGESETAEATAPSAVREIQIRQDLAINKFGWAIRIPAGIDTSTAITLVTRVPTKVKSWRHEAEKLKEEGLAPWRTSLSLTPEERGENMSGVLASRCLLVGFALPELDKLYKSTSAPALQALAGTRPDHEPADIIPQSETMTPVMVVAPLPNLKETATGMCHVR
ncbi:uncharacterized protein THITE_2107205 [Thermothielavioides terrestris NRRL 8126]|jgi:hypothetical protein|uniref:Uncharacterized protein n=1 Tax=Thermothielavioides terrestris (strain ATCC 38088 / NRRL 8126) TaxID=578455 RepID=G2QTA5_THETT|nr:uncharacterized protein THITE_2107205 [Thermothielavioides terrestris NRRL 8126]AEO62722.1 hypothetical protein THITE_2107205 [Thermothielavioides terrestris NRRL 8126]